MFGFRLQWGPSRFIRPSSSPRSGRPRTTLGRLLLAAAAVLALSLGGANGMGAEAADAGSLEAKRAQAAKKFAENNWNDSLGLYKELCFSEENAGAVAGEDLQQAFQCLQNLGRIDEADGLLEKTVDVHEDDWRVLWKAAEIYAQQIQHDGFIVSGEFRRGPHRGGGEWALALARDRARALQLLVQALPSANEADDKSAAAEFYLTLARAMTAYNGAAEAWRLQHLTDVSELPDYERQWYYANQGVGAPVDEEGNPIYFRAPKSWEAAQSDGERWRWAMEQAVEVDPGRRWSVLFEQAQFFEQMYGVGTLANGGFQPLFSGREGDEEDESGTYALHTLKDNETIARLATGVRRFELPEEFNPIKLYETIEEARQPSLSENAANALANLYLNRRQYPQAAEWWKKSIEKYGPGGGNYKQRELANIVDPWGMFEPIGTQPAGEKATFEFRFRNGEEVEFVARRVKIRELLDDVKAYLKKSGERLEWETIDVSDIGMRLVQGVGSAKYVGEQVAKWTEKLDPRPNHFDDRVRIESPLDKAGAYLVTAKMKGGNTCNVLLWLADSAIVKKPLDQGKNLYFCADAVTGAPLAGAKLDFFGYKQEHLGNGRFRTVTSQFAETTDENGMVVPDPRDLKTEYQWLVTLIGEDETRLAYLGYDYVWGSQYAEMQYNAVKAYLMTDRPVYRPEQTVHFKAWLRKAQYDNEGSDFAGADVQLVINDPQGNNVWEKQLQADAYGGVEASFDLTGDATLGQYYINVTNMRPKDGQFAAGGGMFRVEEYKKPEFEVKVEAPSEPVMLGEKVTGKIEARYYFGSPVANATVKYKILRTEHDERWYPRDPWDWMFGRGYWWFAYDYPWYPGWERWVGCIAPPPWWMYQGANGPPEVVAEVEVPIGDDGVVEFEIDTLLAKETMGDRDHKYTIEAEVRDQSRRTIVGTGSILVARKPFEVYTWLERGYYRTGDVVEARIHARTIADRPVSGEAAATLYQIAYDRQGEPIETPVRSWKLEMDEEGTAELDFRASASGQYRFACDVDDGNGHTVSGGYIFTIIGEDFDGGDFRFNELELIPDKANYAPGETVHLQINADQPNATVLLFVKPSNGVYLPPRMLKLKGKSTVVDIEVAKKDMPNFFVEAVTVSGAQDYSVAKEIVVPPEKRILNLEVLPSSETYKPGEKAKVKIHLTDFSGENYQGTTVVSIYDKSLEYISGGGNTEDIKEFFWKWRRTHQPYELGSLDKSSYNLVRDYKDAMQFLGIFGATVVEETKDKGAPEGAKPQSAVMRKSMMRSLGARGPTPSGAPMAAASAADGIAMEAAAAPAADAAAFGAAGGELVSGVVATNSAAQGQPGPMVQPTVRTNFADLALWRGSVTTDATGVAEVELDMPENLTAWKIKVWAMGHGTRVGSGEAEVVTRKDLLIRMQAPRFFIQTDEVVLSANVHNYLDAAKQVEVALELPGEELVALNEADLKRTIDVPAGGESRVDWRVKVVREGTAKIRMLALTDEESDAMEMTFPSYVHGFEKMEAWAGTVRPDDRSEKFTIHVPEERRPEQSVLQVRYSPTLAGAMVDALPYLADFPYGCTEQTLNRFVPSVITKKTLIDMGVDLQQIREKRANLNAQEIGDPAVRAAQWKRYDRNPVFDPEELDRMVKEGVKALANMQCADGGWGWFSGYGEQSWPHTTAVVVNGLMRAREADVALPDGMLERGIEWLARYEAEQIAKLQRFDRKEDLGKRFADELDSLIYMLLTDADRENRTMRDYLYRDRGELAVYAKATFGLGLEQVGDQEKLDMILENISQFLVQDDENETAYLRLPESDYWWYWYGSETEANAYYLKLLARTDGDADDGQGQTAPRLVKYLLNNRKHGTYWKSTRDTALCVEAFAEYLSRSDELRPDMTVQVLLDGELMKAVEINAGNLFAYDDRFLLEGVAVPTGSHEIEIRRTGKGPVYWNAYLTNFTLEEFITEAGLEVKVERQYYKLVPEDASVIAPGQRGQVLDRKVEKYRREPLKTGDDVKSGDLLEIELTIESKNDYEYLVFEDAKAAGCEPVDVQSGYRNDGMHAYVEFRDEKVTFFVRQLARGTHSLRYRVRAEIPGKFSALPAVGQGMYSPELRGNSDEMKLGIEDSE
ncbi:MAG TPA: MG2 domain-containing protein [Pirellulaceae bacterium]|nr:MG2 domain-containing protein [Pirellulaceae bacterium]